MDAHSIRERFLDFFAAADHTVVRSSSLVPANDPTLYFVNAGMVQFKDVFVGDESRPYQRAASSQKCLRVSGKHNDLEAVGRTARHHTFFEMLGNFSFGDYFKKEAIELAWGFLVDQLALDPKRMIATVFGGDDDVPADEEAYQLWHETIGLPEEQVVRLGKADNFWAMGDTGPCGPCSEIHYHQGDELPCNEPSCLGVACECDRWVEIWNLVFMQFNRLASGELKPLARTGVDTGMGLERLAAVVQGVTTTYETDLLRPLLDFVAELGEKRYGAAPDSDVSMRVIADHARASAFCIADGVFPEKGGREYVLRRIMRRAIRHGKLLGLDELFFDKVCLRVVDLMGDAFPELRERREVITKVAEAEETAFRRTLNRGLQKLNDALDEALGRGEAQLDDAVVGNLYATDGFPIDLTRLIAEERGLRVDEQRAHDWVIETHGAGDSKVGDAAVAGVYKQLFEQHGPTRFIGYDAVAAETPILALLAVDQGKPSEVEQAATDASVEVVVAETPFYGRGGGQVGDTGTIATSEGRIEVTDTIKPGGQLIVHQGRVVEGTIASGATAKLEIDAERRQAIKLNHSATHLLHHALRTVLGPHVAQKGSEVAPARLRFDFSHFEGLSAEQIERIERQVNAQIRLNTASRIEEMGFDEARQLGAMALFGEKYGDRVRVVRIGDESVELCGGTHVQSAGEIGLFTVAAEEPLALGVRRIVALTGEGALEAAQSQQRRLREAAAMLKVGETELTERLEKLLSQLKTQDRELARLKQQLATGGGTDLMQQVRDVDGIKVLATRVEAGRSQDASTGGRQPARQDRQRCSGDRRRARRQGDAARDGHQGPHQAGPRGQARRQAGCRRRGQGRRSPRHGPGGWAAGRRDRSGDRGRMRRDPANARLGDWSRRKQPFPAPAGGRRFTSAFSHR